MPRGEENIVHEHYAMLKTSNDTSSIVRLAIKAMPRKIHQTYSQLPAKVQYYQAQ